MVAYVSAQLVASGKILSETFGWGYHAALILGFVSVIAWILQSSNVKACIRRKRLMDITAILWTISLMFGIATYLAFYL